MDAPLYLYFCRPDTLFHDVPTFEDGTFALSSAPPADGWSRFADREWVTYLPASPLPRQGWKVHVSTTPAEAEDTLAVSARYCLAKGLAFKFLKSRECVMARSSKYADRAGSGKFVTIYPRDDAQLAEVLDELGTALDGRQGPYILSDVRWRRGPLYLRYGSFVNVQARAEDGALYHAVEDPDGRLVPDHRGPGFRPPPWVEPPPPVRQAVADRQAARLTGFPYRPTEALHFSNGGGVYRGISADDRPVLLKEARPFAGLDNAGVDAVARLERERWAYERLAGLPEIPEVLDYRRGHDHYFLVREDIDGEDLQHLVFARNPLLRADATRADFASYAAWAAGVLDRVERGLEAMHRRGVVYADLHPGNVMVCPDGSVRFIDLEASRPADDRSGQTMAAPGYAAPRCHTGPAIDRYALGILRVAVFVPMPSLLNWETSKLTEFLGMVRAYFPVAEDFEDRVRADLALPALPGPPVGLDATAAGRPERPLVERVTASGWPVLGEPTGAPAWQRIADRLAGGILACATPERQDRLYPGDVQQLLRPGASLGLSHGAAGVQWALRASGYEVPDAHRSWLRDAVRRHRWDDPGLADGLAGVALALGELGDPDLAGQLLATAIAMVDQGRSWRLDRGSAGVGLAAVRLAGLVDDPGPLVAQAIALARRTEHLDPAATPPRDATPGLLGGWTGLAAFLVGLHAETGDPRLLDRAAELLRADLAALRSRRDPAAPAGISPLLARGAGGTALVADRLLRHRDDAGLAADRDLVLRQTAVPFLVEGGLFAGRAGLMAVRQGLAADGYGADDPVGERHLRALGLHVVGLGADLAVFAPLALRLSCDLATGSAGVLTSVRAAVAGCAVDLPLLPPAVRARQLEGVA